MKILSVVSGYLDIRHVYMLHLLVKWNIFYATEKKSTVDRDWRVLLFVKEGRIYLIPKQAVWSKAFGLVLASSFIIPDLAFWLIEGVGLMNLSQRPLYGLLHWFCQGSAEFLQGICGPICSPSTVTFCLFLTPKKDAVWIMGFVKRSVFYIFPSYTTIYIKITQLHVTI